MSTELRDAADAAPSGDRQAAAPASRQGDGRAHVWHAAYANLPNSDLHVALYSGGRVCLSVAVLTLCAFLHVQVPLEKGYSQMEWMKLARTHPDLAGVVRVF